jgi:murein DD-endopeptidase MepM/ murein hydrolase activator NlpD
MAKEKRYTLLIVPDVPGQVKRIKVGEKALKIGVGLLAAAIVAFIAMGTVSFISAQRLADLRRLQRENQIQKEQLLIFASKIDDIKQTLDRVSEFDAKLRVITNAGDRPIAAIPGTGGPTAQDAASLAGAGSDGSFLIEKMHQDLEELSLAARNEERSIQELSSFFQDQRSLLAATPSIWPTRGWVTSIFGSRSSPFTGEPAIHEGLDIASGIGTWVKSSADGIVTFAGVKGGYGKIIIVDHGYGISTRYAHLSEVHVAPGQRIYRGDRIGNVGNTGRSTGPHLHYEVRVNNLPVNPMRYILD